MGKKVGCNFVRSSILVTLICFLLLGLIVHSGQSAPTQSFNGFPNSGGGGGGDWKCDAMNVRKKKAIAGNCAKFAECKWRGFMDYDMQEDECPFSRIYDPDLNMCVADNQDKFSNCTKKSQADNKGPTVAANAPSTISGAPTSTFDKNPPTNSMNDKWNNNNNNKFSMSNTNTMSAFNSPDWSMSSMSWSIPQTPTKAPSKIDTPTPAANDRPQMNNGNERQQMNSGSRPSFNDRSQTNNNNNGPPTSSFNDRSQTNGGNGNNGPPQMNNVNERPQMNSGNDRSQTNSGLRSSFNDRPQMNGGNDRPQMNSGNDRSQGNNGSPMMSSFNNGPQQMNTNTRNMNNEPNIISQPLNNNGQVMTNDRPPMNSGLPPNNPRSQDNNNQLIDRPPMNAGAHQINSGSPPPSNDQTQSPSINKILPINEPPPNDQPQFQPPPKEIGPHMSNYGPAPNDQPIQNLVQSPNNQLPAEKPNLKSISSEPIIMDPSISKTVPLPNEEPHNEKPSVNDKKISFSNEPHSMNVEPMPLETPILKPLSAPNEGSLLTDIPDMKPVSHAKNKHLKPISSGHEHSMPLKIRGHAKDKSTIKPMLTPIPKMKVHQHGRSFDKSTPLLAPTGDSEIEHIEPITRPKITTDSNDDDDHFLVKHISPIKSETDSQHEDGLHHELINKPHKTTIYRPLPRVTTTPRPSNANVKHTISGSEWINMNNARHDNSKRFSSPFSKFKSHNLVHEPIVKPSLFH